MALLLWLGLSLLAYVHSTAVKNCHPGCLCEVESFGLFDSFSLTRVECRGLGPGSTMPILIPLDTTHLDLSSNAMGPLSDTMLAGPGYTTLVSLDLSSNHITKVSTQRNSRIDLKLLNEKITHKLLFKCKVQFATTVTLCGNKLWFVWLRLQVCYLGNSRYYSLSS